MKINLSEQIKELIELDKKNKESHLVEFFKNTIKPEKLFKMNNVGEIKEIQLLGFSIGFSKDGRFIYPPYYNIEKRPSKNLISEYLEYIEKTKKSEVVVFVDYKDFGRGSFKFKELVENKLFSFNEEDLKEESIRRKEVYGSREGFTPCGYCGKQTADSELIERTIIGRGRKEVYNSWKKRYESKACVTETKMKFCSAQCAGNDQMSREG